VAGYYNDTLSPADQVDMEEQIASMIFYEDEVETDEETANCLGRAILHMVLEKFRPDFFTEEE
jgi:hypothetical protein